MFRSISRRSRIVLCGTIFLFLTIGTGRAETLTFTDKMVFVDAAGTLGVESFESLSTSVPSTDPIMTDGLTVEISGDASADMFIEDLGPEGETATDGTKFILAGASETGGSLTLTFTLPDPALAFGLNIADFGDNGTAGVLSIGTNVGDAFNIATSGGRGSFPNNNKRFFGLIRDVEPFSIVTLTKTTTGDGIGVDEVYATTIPSPSTCALSGSIYMLLYFRRRGNRGYVHRR